MRRIYLALLILLGNCHSGYAFEWLTRKESVYLFGGEFTRGTFPGWTLIPFASESDNNYIVGGAYEVQFANLGWGILLGTEIGLAGRFGADTSSAELWGGVSLRHKGIPIGNVVTISPGIVIGLSAVSDAIGVEREREIQAGGSATLLYYMGPELAFRFSSLPYLEFVFRTHHRSGLLGSLGKMREGANANIFGVRFYRQN